ncbi:MAG TPA: hypothetical protein DER60_07730 [Syntrophomonas sp.]|nr:hypothetical protein [Syntrophomonas sp.]
MRKWRVGTFSMGLLMVLSGVGILLAQIQGISALGYALKWWPLLFIVLGVEVLLQSYFSGAESSPIKYDIFSIFIILLMVTFGLSLQAASETGLVRYVQQNITAERFYVQSEREIAVEQGIQKVVVEAERCARLEVSTGSGESILCNIQAGIRSQSKAEAEQILQNQTQVAASRSGSTMYLRLGFAEAYNHGTFSLVLPEKVAVEIAHGPASLAVVNAQLKKDWLITGAGSVDVILAPKSDVLLSVIGPDPLELKGNMNWTDPQGQPVQAPVRQQEGQVPEKIGEEKGSQAQARLGQALHKLSIVHKGGGITVNQLP